MADLITVEDPDDPRLRDYTGLTDVELRRKREPAEGLFIAEGEKVIRRAKEAGYEMRSMLLSAKWVDVMRDVIDELPAPVYAVSPELAEQVTGYHVHRGALASMQRKPLPTAADLLRSARRVVVMESVNDHTNIGAIFRSAAALGMDAVLLSPDCADPLYRRSVKVSMGAVFSVPYARLDTWPKSLESVREAGFTLLALTPDEKMGIDDPIEMQRLGEELPIERAASRFIVSDDPDEHVERIGWYIDLGFRHLVFHDPGHDQAAFLKRYGDEILPRLRAKYGA